MEYDSAPVVVEELLLVGPVRERAALHSERRAQAHAARKWWEQIEMLMIFLEVYVRSDLYGV